MHAVDLRGHGPSDWPGTYSIRLMTDDVVDLLPRLTDRAVDLLVAGGPSSTVPQDHVADLARTVGDARMVTIDAGHLVHATPPQAFIEVVTEFLG